MTQKRVQLWTGPNEVEENQVIAQRFFMNFGNIWYFGNGTFSFSAQNQKGY